MADSNKNQTPQDFINFFSDNGKVYSDVPEQSEIEHEDPEALVSDIKDSISQLFPILRKIDELNKDNEDLELRTDPVAIRAVQSNKMKIKEKRGDLSLSVDKLHSDIQTALPKLDKRKYDELFNFIENSELSEDIKHKLLNTRVVHTFKTNREEAMKLKDVLQFSRADKVDESSETIGEEIPVETAKTDQALPINQGQITSAIQIGPTSFTEPHPTSEDRTVERSEENISAEPVRDSKPVDLEVIDETGKPEQVTTDESYSVNEKVELEPRATTDLPTTDTTAEPITQKDEGVKTEALPEQLSGQKVINDIREGFRQNLGETSRPATELPDFLKTKSEVALSPQGQAENQSPQIVPAPAETQQVDDKKKTEATAKKAGGLLSRIAGWLGGGKKPKEAHEFAAMHNDIANKREVKAEESELK